MLESLELGKKYLTRNGRVATVTKISTWDSKSWGASGVAYISIDDGTSRIVFLDGTYIGRGDTKNLLEHDIISSLETPPTQLDLF